MVGTILPLTVQGAKVVRRGKTLIGPVDLTLDGGALTIVMGPNGSGKTSMLRMLHGIERLREGRVDWNLSKDQARTRQAFVFQQPVMMRRSVEDNLTYPLTLTGTAKPDARARARDWAERIGLGQALGRRATVLSGGERQKLALARALIRAPEVLFLDEPCASLDGRATREIEAILMDARASGTRIIMATHDMGQARRLADEVLFILHGKLHEQGVASAFFDAPRTREARAFLQGDIVD